MHHLILILTGVKCLMSTNSVFIKPVPLTTHKSRGLLNQSEHTLLIRFFTTIKKKKSLRNCLHGNTPTFWREKSNLSKQKQKNVWSSGRGTRGNAVGRLFQLTGLPMSLSCLSDVSLLSHSSSAFSLSMNNCRKAQRRQVYNQRED